MKTYACLNCGQGMESGEFALPSGHRSLYRRCPSCGSPVSLSGLVFMVAGLLLALSLFMIPTDETEVSALVGGGGLVALGLTRLILQHCAGQRWKREPVASLSSHG